MGMTPENVFKLIEAFRLRGYTVLVRAIPDVADSPSIEGRYSVMIRGHEAFVGPTLLDAMQALVTSRCWERPVPAGTPNRVKVADILELVEETASQYTAPFQADAVATELNVFPSAVAHALKKLQWPKSSQKATTFANGREIEVYVYLPKIG